MFGRSEGFRGFGARRVSGFGEFMVSSGLGF